MADKPKKILIIDDSEDALFMYRIMIERLGAVVTVARSGEEGLVKFDEDRPDLIFLDMRMPGMNGVEVAKRLRELEYEGAIIAFTAGVSVTGKTGKQESLEAGIDKYISKTALTRKVVEALIAEYCK